jgi:hypothetical protein
MQGQRRKQQNGDVNTDDNKEVFSDSLHSLNLLRI